MVFAKNDLVVVPGCGVGQVEAIETLRLDEDRVKTYRIAIRGTELVTWIPVDRSDELRSPMDEARLEAIWDCIDAASAPKKRSHWKRRRQRYRDMMLSNDPDTLASLVGELAAIRDVKKEKRQVLSFDERRIFERARTLLEREIAASTGREQDEITDEVERALAP